MTFGRSYLDPVFMDPVLKTLPSQAQGLGGLGDIVAEMLQSLADNLVFIIIHQTLKGAAIPVKGCFRSGRPSGGFFWCALRRTFLMGASP